VPVLSVPSGPPLIVRACYYVSAVVGKSPRSSSAIGYHKAYRIINRLGPSLV